MTWLTIQLRKHYTYQDSKSIWAPLYLTTWPKSSKTKKWHWTVRGFRWFWNECIPTMSYTLTFLVWCSVSPPLARYLCPQIWFLDAWDCVSLLFFLSFPCSMEPSTYCIQIVFITFQLYAFFRSSWPNTSYMKATDLWTLFCYLGVFYSLTEYCIVLYLTKWADWEIELKTQKNKDKKLFQKPEDERIQQRENRMKLLKLAGKIEFASRIFVPLYFLVFVLLYWIICLSKSQWE